MSNTTNNPGYIVINDRIYDLNDFKIYETEFEALKECERSLIDKLTFIYHRFKELGVKNHGKLIISECDEVEVNIKKCISYLNSKGILFNKSEDIYENIMYK